MHNFIIIYEFNLEPDSAEVLQFYKYDLTSLLNPPNKTPTHLKVDSTCTLRWAQKRLLKIKMLKYPFEYPPVYTTKSCDHTC